MEQFNYSQNLHAIPWNQFRAVIFDLDGTLYDIKKFQFLAFKKFLLHLLLKPRYYKDYKAVKCYYTLLKEKSGQPSNNLSDLLSAESAQQLGYSVEFVQSTVRKWGALLTPLIAKAKYQGLDNFFQLLEDYNILRAVYSDQSVEEKMQYLALSGELYVSSLDHPIATLKPTVKGLTYILNKLELKPQQCIFIGDSYHLDGKSAEMMGMPFFILPKMSDSSKKQPNLYSMLAASLLNSKNKPDAPLSLF